MTETPQVQALHHKRPFWPVHIVVVPKQRAPSLTDLDGRTLDLVHKVLAVTTAVAKNVTEEHGACRVLTNQGRYQASRHLHFHVAFGEPPDPPAPSNED